MGTGAGVEKARNQVSSRKSSSDGFTSSVRDTRE